MFQPHIGDRERGAVLPIVIPLIVVLLVFAAFTVDLGAAWAERRQDQTAADAAVMAAAIEYIRSNPSEQEVVALVKDYVHRNIGYPIDAAGWSECPLPTDGFEALAGNNCISLKQASTTSSDTLLQVRIPDQHVPTAFASIVGINEIDVSAFAIAQIQKQEGLQGAMPFVLPGNPGLEYCLGTPPDGQAREMCEGPSTGLFGTIISPFFGEEADPWGTTSCQDAPTNINDGVRTNTAIGIDHFLRIAPDDGVPAEGADVCAATEAPSYVPYAILADNGELTQISPGFIGPDTYGSIPSEGRLLQGTGTKRPVPSGKDFIQLDNVGLWEYLVDPGALGDACSPTQFADKSGTELTAQMIDCLKNGTVKFTDDLLDSPRFALVPQVALDQANIGLIGTNPANAANIIKFVPVYLQATWYNCSAVECMFFPADNTTAPEDTPMVFDPGEGSVPGCLGDLDKCTFNVNLVMSGVSSFVLDNETWLPDAFNNQFNEPGAYNVSLYR